MPAVMNAIQMISTTIRRALGLATAWGLLVSASPVRAAENGEWDGHLSLRWDMLTQRNSPTPDYQDLRGLLRLHSPRYTNRDLQLHLDLDARQGLDEQLADGRQSFNRRRLRHAHVDLDLARWTPDLRTPPPHPERARGRQCRRSHLAAQWLCMGMGAEQWLPSALLESEHSFLQRDRADRR